MKKTIKESLKALLADRHLLSVLVLTVVLSIFFSIMMILSIKSSDSQLVTHYSDLGQNSIYRDQWFYFFVFVAFELVVATLHVAISIKILLTKGRSLAIAFAWTGVSILLIGWVTIYSLINIWKP